MSKSAAMHIALGVDYLKQQGLVSLEEIWSKFASKRAIAGLGPAYPMVWEVRSNAAPISIIVSRGARCWVY